MDRASAGKPRAPPRLEPTGNLWKLPPHRIEGISRGTRHHTGNQTGDLSVCFFLNPFNYSDMTAAETAAEFDRLVDSYYKPLFRFGMSLSGSEGTACDLVQQTFYNWAAKGHQLRDRSRAKAWLFTTLHREFLQLIRRQSRIVALEDTNEDAAVSEEPAPEPEAIADFDADDLYAALAEVPETFREALNLFYLEEFSYAEIAEVLEVPIGTVMSRLSRGKQKLRKRLRMRRAASKLDPVRFTPERKARHG